MASGSNGKPDYFVMQDGELRKPFLSEQSNEEGLPHDQRTWEHGTLNCFFLCVSIERSSRADVKECGWQVAVAAVRMINVRIKTMKANAKRLKQDGSVDLE